ncbi:MAG: CapA family protein [Patescibacteria group bacterium]
MIAFSAAFATLESRVPVFRTLSGSAQTSNEKATVLFVGDMMFDRHIRTVLERSSDEVILGEVRELLSEADMNVGNLEGPITDNLSQSQGSKVGDITNMRFTFSPSVRELLTEYGFGLVSIGNNHIRDFDTAGVRSTTSYLSSAGIAYVGDPTGASPEPVVKEINGVRIAFVAYSDFVGGDAERARRAISESTADATVVLAHWGNEYETEPSDRIRTLAASFVSAGADLIIGSHPHVIGSVEEVGSARMYYSLGNFVFDQYWEPSVRCGLVVKATFIKGEEGTRITYEEEQVGMKNTGATVPGCS